VRGVGSSGPWEENSRRWYSRPPDLRHMLLAMDMTHAIRLEVFSDYTCPWCYVGWARLRTALRELSEEVVVDVDWRPFEIHPEVLPAGMPVEDLPYPRDVWARMQDTLRESAAAEGLEVGRRPKVSNTHRALLAGSYVQAEDAGVFEAFHERLFTGYFAEGHDLGDATVIDQLALEAGVDVPRLQEVLDGGQYESALVDATRDARMMGISGTPTFVFDRRFATSGAQPAEVLLSAFDEALNHMHGA
jgi:predicted DsbA family dithiol-disulfide isomerase